MDIQQRDAAGKRCAEEGHGKEESRKSVLEFKYCHCSGNHAAGSKDCSKQQRECETLKIQMQQKVTFCTARQIQAGESEKELVLKEEVVRRFECSMSEADRKKFSLWSLEKSIENYIGAKPRSIRAKSKETFTVKISTKVESERMKGMRTINGCKVTTTVSKDRQIRAIIYEKKYNMIEFEAYKKGLMEQFGFQDVVEASWIKVKNVNTKPLLKH